MYLIIYVFFVVFFFFFFFFFSSRRRHTRLTCDWSSDVCSPDLSANAKSEQIRAYYGSLHPLLRVGLSTLLVFDRDAVITDLGRRPEDYRTMGLPQNAASLHRSEERRVGKECRSRWVADH